MTVGIVSIPEPLKDPTNGAPRRMIGRFLIVGSSRVSGQK